MLTQCPHCLTLFRVGPEHLKAAAGQVRCCRCHRVFNALQSLQEAPASFVNSRITSEMLADLPAADEPARDLSAPQEEQSDWEDFQSASGDDALQRLLPDFDSDIAADEFLHELVEQDDGLEPEPDYLTCGSESQMSELLDQDSSSILLPDSEEPNATLPTEHTIVTFNAPPPLETEEEPAQDGFYSDETTSAEPDTEETTSIPLAWDEIPEQAPPEPEKPDDENEQSPDSRGFEAIILKDRAIDEELGRPDYDSAPAFRLEQKAAHETPETDDHALNFEAVAAPRQQKRINPLWLIGSLLLALPLSGQIAWQFRDSLIQHDTGRQALQLICRVAGCEVPTRRALDKIAIQGRNLTTHPDKPDALFLQVSIVNKAGFDQPFPRLSLSLYNDKGALIARRAFSATDYLPPAYRERRMMPRAEPILVEMELMDPGKDVTGFSFDFF